MTAFAKKLLKLSITCLVMLTISFCGYYFSHHYSHNKHLYKGQLINFNLAIFTTSKIT